MHTERKWFTATNGLIILAIIFTLTLIPLNYESYSLDRTLTQSPDILFFHITAAVSYYNSVLS